MFEMLFLLAPLLGPPVQPAAAAAPADPRIGRIVVRVDDVFEFADGDEGGRVYRLANRLHRRTQPETIRRQLLFKTGDPYSERTARETERLLRSNEYLREAQVRSLGLHDGEVDLEVAAQDVWTLNPSFSFGRGGGANAVRFKVEDVNLLGTGKAVAIEHTSDVDRSSDFVRFLDPGLMGSRVRLQALYAVNSDGGTRRLDVERPFYALDSRWQAGLRWLEDEKTVPIYRLGSELESFHQRHTRLDLQSGRSRGLERGRVRRWTAGLTYQSDRFEIDPEAPLTTVLPDDRTFVYPWIGFDSIEDDFLEVRDLDRMSRTEDLLIGKRLHLRLGLASSALGSTGSAAIYDAGYGAGWQLSQSQTLLWSASAAGRWGGGGAEDLRVTNGLRFHWRNLGKHLFFAQVETELVRHPDPETQLLLGGDSGLRGYPLRYQDGDLKALLTLEQRFYTKIEIFHILRVGGAVFFDAGRTWTGESARAPNLGLLRDIGVGLRLGSERSALGSVIHFDVAFPLDGEGSIRSLQWLVKSRSSF